MKILIPTYPRCGSHFLTEHFLQKTGVVMNKTHIPMLGSYDFYVTIIRDPRDSIVSRLAMELEFEENPKTMEDYLEICKNEYVVFYKYIIKSMDMVFHYDQIASEIEKVIDFICKETKIEKKSNDFKDNIHDKPITGFLKTSKTGKHYEYSKDFMKDKDLEECYNLYTMCKEKVVSLD